MKWSYFIGSSLLGGYIVLLLGAPLMTVLAGVILAAGWNAFKRRASSRAVNI